MGIGMITLKEARQLEKGAKLFNTYNGVEFEYTLVETPRTRGKLPDTIELVVQRGQRFPRLVWESDLHEWFLTPRDRTPSANPLDQSDSGPSHRKG